MSGPSSISCLVAWTLGALPAVVRAWNGSARQAVTCLMLATASAALIWLFRSMAAPRRAGDLLALISLTWVSAAAVSMGFVYPLFVVGLGTSVAYGVFIRWELPLSWRQRRRGVAGVALAPLVAAELVWYRDGSPLRFAALVLVCAGVLEVYARAPQTAATVERLVERAAVAIARVITVVATSAVMIFVIVPVSIISRVFRYSPLDGGWSTASSAWVEVDPQRLRGDGGVPSRPESMASLEPRATRSVRRRGHLRLLVPTGAVVMVALAAGPGWISLPWFGFDSTETAGDTPDTFTRPFEEDPAFKDAPWARTLRMNLLDTWNNLEFNAALGGWQIRDVESEFINVEGGERLTVAPNPALGEPLEVWLLGGSAAFGAGQRDDQTIASDLVRLAGKDHLPLAVHNLAVPATVNWQSAVLLLALLKWERPPDLVIVYDGANDLTLQGVLAGEGRGHWDRPASLIDGELDEILRDRAAADPGARDALPRNRASEPDEAPTPEDSGRIAIERYRRGVEVMRAATSAASVPLAVFWQPDLRAKQPLSAADNSTLAAINSSPDLVDQWRISSDVARAGLGPMGVTDLTSTFDGEERPVYWDTVHTNELGASLVAGAMYLNLKPMLLNLWEQTGPASGG